MGNGPSANSANRKCPENCKEQTSAESSRILFLLYLIHRSWNAVIEHVDSKSTRWRSNRSEPNGSDFAHYDSISLPCSDLGSEHSSCECSYCRLRECIQSGASDLTTFDEMTACSSGWSEEPVPKEKQRPPIYNPEDYATSLKKWGKKIAVGGLYETGGIEAAKSRTLPVSGKDYRSPGLVIGEEMSLKQFGTPNELLAKLRADLRLSFQSFVQEFACKPLDGVTLLLELLRNIQLSQGGEGARVPPALRRRPLLDELACLQCLWSCVTRHPDSVRRLLAGSAGACTLTACIMSTVNKSRVLALQLLTKACYVSADGHATVSEALSSLRLRFGEPVRFRFLVGMLQSIGSSGELHAAGLEFLNALMTSAPSPQRKLYIQAELEQAGFDIITLKMMVSKLPSSNEKVMKEIENYEKQLIDVETLNEKAKEAQKEKDELKQKLDLLEKRVKILQEEKGILLSLEKCLKEKCSELQDEVSTLKSEYSSSGRKKIYVMKRKTHHKNKDESSPPEDEGISSSERSLSPEGDPQRESMVYEMFNMKNETYDMLRQNCAPNKNSEVKKAEGTKMSEDEDETTIEDVIKELRDIVNDVASEQNSKQNTKHFDEKSGHIQSNDKFITEGNQIEKTKKDSVTSTKHTIQITNSPIFTRKNDNSFCKPEVIHFERPPPRKAKSLLHLFAPENENSICCNKTRGDNSIFYSSEDGSDSLLSGSRFEYQFSRRNSVSTYDFDDAKTVFDCCENRDNNRQRRSRTRSKQESRRNSVKRSESFQASEKNFRQRKQSSILSGDTNSSVILEAKPPIRRSHSRGSRVDEIVNRIESKTVRKSLEAIDSGLNSMVDVVITDDFKTLDLQYKRRQRSLSRIENNLINETPSLPYRHSTSNTYSYDVYDPIIDYKWNTDYKPKSEHKFFLPNPKRISASFEKSPYDATFLIKRGHSNAGIYSGNHSIMREAPASITSLVPIPHQEKVQMRKTLSPVGPSYKYGIDKVTDMPSGLY